MKKRRDVKRTLFFHALEKPETQPYIKIQQIDMRSWLIHVSEQVNQQGSNAPGK